MKKKSFMLYIDSYEQIRKLTPLQKAQLLDAVFIFASTGETLEFSDIATEITFGFIKQQMERDNEKYVTKSEKNAQYYRSKKNSETEKSEKGFKKNSAGDTDKDTDNDTDNDTDTERDTDIISNGSEISAPAHTPDKKIRRFGAYQHVRLTDMQYKRLAEDFGEGVVADYIKSIDEWVQLKGNAYKDYYLAVRNWIEQDKAKKGCTSEEDFDVEKYKAFINNF